MAKTARSRQKQSDLVEKIVHIARVAKVVKGGRRFSFRATVVVGDGKGKAGFGTGKASEVMSAINKAVQSAKKNMRNVPLKGNTIPHEVVGRYKGAQVLLKPAIAGTGVIAGGHVRAVAECAGIHNVLSKSMNSNNALSVVKATFNAFDSMKDINKIAALRGKTVEELKGA